MDLDFAVAVANDSEAEDVVLRLRGRGYQPVGVLEQDYTERLSGVRLNRAGSDVIVDLLFATYRWRCLASSRERKREAGKERQGTG